MEAMCGKEKWDSYKHAMDQLGETYCISPAEFIGLLSLYISHLGREIMPEE